MQVAIADDSALFRDGLTWLLKSVGVDVAVAVPTGVEVEHAVRTRPVDAVITDIRMPPTFTDEGIASALRLRGGAPSPAVLLLSAHVQVSDAVRLLAHGAAGVGYLLKDRVDDVDTLHGALERLVSGETVLDPQVVASLLPAVPRAPGPLAGLSRRELTVLRLMAEGRSNAGIGAELYLSPKTVERHVAAVFTKLRLSAAATDNRRVRAVLVYLQAESPAG